MSHWFCNIISFGGGPLSAPVAELGRWPKTMKNVTHSVAVSMLLVFAVGCTTAKQQRLSVDIPEGIVAVTDSQKALVVWVRGLKAGTNKEQVENALGIPTARAKDVWFYRLPESSVYGGYWVTATLTFDGEDLSAAKVGGGHETRAQRVDH